MTRETGRAALVIALTFVSAAVARAQGAAQPEPTIDASLSAGLQVESRTFADNTSFALYNELATVRGEQQVGRGLVVDGSVGYRVHNKLSIAVGVWSFHTSSDTTLTASIPDPLFFGKPVTRSVSAAGLAQNLVGVNVQVVWTTALSDKLDAAIFLGPSILHVSQDIGSVNVATGTQNATAAAATETATTAKAGSLGVDLRYKMNDRYGVGLFVRYAGGEVNLPSAPRLKVGGAQVGLGLRARF